MRVDIICAHSLLTRHLFYLRTNIIGNLNIWVNLWANLYEFIIISRRHGSRGRNGLGATNRMNWLRESIGTERVSALHGLHRLHSGHSGLRFREEREQMLNELSIESDEFVEIILGRKEVSHQSLEYDRDHSSEKIDADQNKEALTDAEGGCSGDTSTSPADFEKRKRHNIYIYIRPIISIGIDAI
jgi:hypothetical protein